MLTSASHGDSEVTPNAKSVIWAGIVIFALAATIWYLLPHGQPPAAVPPAKVVRQTSPETIRDRIRSRRPRSARPVVIERSEMRRVEFVSQLQQRFAEKGKSVSVDAVGPEKRTLRLMWAPGRTDHDHMEQIKSAQPFAREARAQGFSSITMQVGERIVWQNPL